MMTDAEVNNIPDGLDVYNERVRQSIVPLDDYEIEMFDIGPKEISSPIICLPPSFCDAKVFYKMQLEMADRKYRIIAINYPKTYNTDDFCAVFSKFLDAIQVSSVHLFGTELGGFLAQLFYGSSHNTGSKVKSLILCNTYSDSAVFGLHAAWRFIWMSPLFGLRMMVNFPNTPATADDDIKKSITWAQGQLYGIEKEHLAARLTMHGIPQQVPADSVSSTDITIIEVGDVSAIAKDHYASINRAYPNAKVAQLETGGHYPYLSRVSEFVAYMQMHFDSYLGTQFTPGLPDDDHH